MAVKSYNGEEAIARGVANGTLVYSGGSKRVSTNHLDFQFTVNTYDMFDYIMYGEDAITNGYDSYKNKFTIKRGSLNVDNCIRIGAVFVESTTTFWDYSDEQPYEILPHGSTVMNEMHNVEVEFYYLRSDGYIVNLRDYFYSIGFKFKTNSYEYQLAKLHTYELSGTPKFTSEWEDVYFDLRDIYLGFKRDPNISKKGFNLVTNVPFFENKKDLDLWLINGPDDPDPGEEGDEGNLNTPHVQSPMSHVYVGSYSDMIKINRILNGDDDTMNTLLHGLQLYQSPIESIIDHFYIPIDIRDFGTLGETTIFSIGNTSFTIDSGITYLADNSKSLLIGAIDLTSRPYGDFRDYQINYSVYLPYCGVCPLDTRLLMGRRTFIRCVMDIRSGNIKYYLFNGTTVYQMFEGDLHVAQPLSGTNVSALRQQTVSGIASITAGAGQIAGGIMTGNPISAVSGGLTALQGFMNMTQIPAMQRSGNCSSATGAYDPLQPLLIVQKPDIVIPSGLYTKYNYPDDSVGTIGSYSGFLQCDHVRIECSATDEELNMINTLCNNGIII